MRDGRERQTKKKTHRKTYWEKHRWTDRRRMIKLDRKRNLTKRAKIIRMNFHLFSKLYQIRKGVCVL